MTATPGDAPIPALAVRELRGGTAGSTPLVLLHGFPVDSRMWESTVAQLPGDRTVLGVDLPGLGGSADVDLPTPPALEAAADAVALALAERGIDRAVVAGLSMGGYVALALLERHPALVAGLGLLDTKATADDDDARVNRLRIADAVEETGSVAEVLPMGTALLGESTRAARPTLAATLTAWIEDQQPTGVAWSQRAMAARPDRSHLLRAFEGPAMVLVGDEDQVTPASVAEPMAAALPAAQLVVVVRSGHMTAVEDPAAVAAGLGDLAQRVDAADA
ncbi:alpha/beta fold hydrolase [Cellulomonas timonensis]|uniref:alpha/beta fold hydrolase n=1 Tax=Cellulomonas timonensis TaxID=1689271 RepID=UPI0009EF2835|nr:alpha/beta hydrolase [Cellulomonas timonensis]